ncbi:hypothetical protein [Fretibacter rubidus]|uniref:hypothetical protein n=1 Tax=Fretibacter rubidus TaxID=570162 RepID=UPI00352B035C
MSFDANILPPVPLNLGEAALAQAPVVQLAGGVSCVPQHYLRYMHTRESVEALLSDVAYDPHYPVFVSDDKGQIIIQIGIVGYDNYKSKARQPKLKIVFGRKWRVEPNLPSSEILQTVFLALQKAREHEVRECLTLDMDGYVTTPFNNHHDMPLMARQKDVLHAVNEVQADMTQADISALLSRVRYDGYEAELIDMEITRLGPILMKVKFDGSIDMLPDRTVLMTADTLSPNAILHGLIDALLAESDRHVKTNFTYRGFARFDTAVDVQAVAKLSLTTRQSPKQLLGASKQKKIFAKTFESERYETDSTRIPTLSSSPYSDKLREQLREFDLSNYAMVCG